MNAQIFLPWTVFKSGRENLRWRCANLVTKNDRDNTWHMTTHLWPSLGWGFQWLQSQSRWHSASVGHWFSCANASRSWLAQTCDRHGTCCRRHPDRICEYHLHGREEYAPRHGQFPRIRHLSDGLPTKCPQFVYWSKSKLSKRVTRFYAILAVRNTDQRVVKRIVPRSSRPAKPTCFWRHRIWLSAVLSHFRMHERHEVRANRCLEHGGQRHRRPGDFTLLAVDTYQRSRSLQVQGFNMAPQTNIFLTDFWTHFFIHWLVWQILSKV